MLPTGVGARAANGLVIIDSYAADAGQDLIEYVLLTGIIAIAGILVFPDDSVHDGHRLSATGTTTHRRSGNPTADVGGRGQASG